MRQRGEGPSRCDASRAGGRRTITGAGRITAGLDLEIREEVQERCVAVESLQEIAYGRIGRSRRCGTMGLLAIPAALHSAVPLLAAPLAYLRSPSAEAGAVGPALLHLHPLLCSPLPLQVVLDLGRPPVARFPSGDVKLSYTAITAQDLEWAVQQVRHGCCCARQALFVVANPVPQQGQVAGQFQGGCGAFVHLHGLCPACFPHGGAFSLKSFHYPHRSPAVPLLWSARWGSLAATTARASTARCTASAACATAPAASSA